MSIWTGGTTCQGLKHNNEHYTCKYIILGNQTFEENVHKKNVIDLKKRGTVSKREL